VLLIMSLAYSHFITPVAALALVLGANLGSAVNPVVEAGHRDDKRWSKANGPIWPTSCRRRTREAELKKTRIPSHRPPTSVTIRVAG
jgi:hypothetical protein